jgi:catechol 2,3-dioxygenase-like lactoylglutathione lyase family enzyme
MTSNFAGALCLTLPFFVAATLRDRGKPARPEITGLSHVIVLDSDLEASSRFYKTLMNWPATPALEAGDAVHYQVGADQYLEVKQAPGPKDPVDRLEHIAFKTTDVKAMLKYLGDSGVVVPDHLQKRADGGTSFLVTDPEGYKVEFVQGGRFPAFSPNAISTNLMHVGMSVHDEAAERHFYVDVLGFRPYWAGWNKDEGHVDGDFDYKSLQVPDGTDWVEFMLVRGEKGGRSRAAWASNPHHVAPGVVDVDAAYEVLVKRGLAQIAPDPRSKPLQGRSGKRQINLFDPDGLRVELMNFKPNQPPCCTPFTGPQPGPAE